jgi:hypothetical protein
MKQFFLHSILLIVLLVVLPSQSINAQKFNRFGGGLVFDSPVNSPDLDIGNPGFNARGVLELSEDFFIIPELTFQVPKKKTYNDGSLKKTTLVNLDVNVTYTLATEGTLLFYALLGPGLSSIYTKWDSDDPNVESGMEFAPGLSVGTGIEMIVEKDINAYAQVKYMVSKYQQLVISIGVHYYFEGRRFRKW